MQPRTRIQEWHFQEVGAVGFFFLDPFSNQFNFKGEVVPGRPLIGEEQWEGLRNALAANIRVIIVCSPSPMLHDSPEQGEEHAEKFPYLRNHWMCRTAEFAQLLHLLFHWKHAQFPFREAVLISGGGKCGCTTDIQDKELGLNLPLVSTGPVAGLCEKWTSSDSGNIDERFSYMHCPLPGQYNFCTMDVDLSSRTMKPSVDIQLIGIPVGHELVLDHRRPVADPP
mmetsp:Transcript_104082/g.238331  ORF Transcript_104082/g.238331 Transcript_104082/m.238331 type:complete len:225 (+) Transcript_104082:1086-1760(+)